LFARKRIRRRGTRAVANIASIPPPIRELRFAITPEALKRHPTSELLSISGPCGELRKLRPTRRGTYLCN
jgi:hypothetical protein